MKNDYFEDQSEVTGRTWPSKTWFQERRKLLACKEHLSCNEGCKPVPVHFNGFILEADGPQKRAL